MRRAQDLGQYRCQVRNPLGMEEMSFFLHGETHACYLWAYSRLCFLLLFLFLWCVGLRLLLGDIVLVSIFFSGAIFLSSLRLRWLSSLYYCGPLFSCLFFFWCSAPYVTGKYFFFSSPVSSYLFACAVSLLFLHCCGRLLSCLLSYLCVSLSLLLGDACYLFLSSLVSSLLSSLPSRSVFSFFIIVERSCLVCYLLSSLPFFGFPIRFRYFFFSSLPALSPSSLSSLLGLSFLVSFLFSCLLSSLLVFTVFLCYWKMYIRLFFAVLALVVS